MNFCIFSLRQQRGKGRRRSQNKMNGKGPALVVEVKDNVQTTIMMEHSPMSSRVWLVDAIAQHSLTGFI
jgi:hypothetical protein